MHQLFNACVRVFCVPNDTILLVYIPAKIKMSFTWKDVSFLPKSASSVSRSQTHLAKQKRIGWSIGFSSWSNWTVHGVIPRSLCKIRLSDVSKMFNCWERRWINVDGAPHTLSATVAIFLGVRSVRGRRGLVGSVSAYYTKSQGSSPRLDIKTKYKKYFFGRFLAKTLRVNKNCHEKFLIKSVVRSRL